MILAVTAALFILVLVVVLSEIAHAKAATQNPSQAGNSIVIILGFPSKQNGTPSLVQRWRCKLAIKAWKQHKPELLIFTGGDTGSGIPESKVMQDLTIKLGVPADRTHAESESENTWENVKFSIPLTSGYANVYIVSDPLHAARARKYWLKQAPEDSSRVHALNYLKLCESIWMKVPTTLVHLMR